MTLSAIFRTMMVVFIPATFVHHMRTFRYDSVAFLETCLAEIARLSNEHLTNAHVARHVLKHIFPLED